MHVIFTGVKSLQENPLMKTNLKIAQLDKTEAPQAVKLLCTAFNEAAAFVEKEIAESFVHKSHRPVTFAASVDGKVVGVVRCRLYYAMRPGDDPIYGLYSLGVDPAFRQQGIGHGLMQHVESYVSKRLAPGQRAMLLLGDKTKKENPASTFYEDMGYTPEPPRLAYEDGVPELAKYVSKPPAPERNAGPASRNLA